MESKKQYEIIREIGKGGMGKVFLCRDNVIDRIVAIKIMNSKKSGRDMEYALRRFNREALITARLQHPRIPPVFSIGKVKDGRPYFAMKLIEGQPLSEILVKLKNDEPNTKNKFTLHRLIEILINVCEAVQYAHSKKYIHRDLKPSNIFIGDYGEVYLIDWGLTKYIDEKEPDETKEFNIEENDEIEISSEPDSDLIPALDESITIDGEILGTPAYMSPEQINVHTEQIGVGADIYGLGAILYHILTLKHPFHGYQVKEILNRKKAGFLIDPYEMSPEMDIPPELSSICLQAMTNNVETRTNTVSEFREGLSFWLNGSTLFRQRIYNQLEFLRFTSIPQNTTDRWTIKNEFIRTISKGKGQSALLYFQKPLSGELKIEFNLRVLTNQNTNADLEMPRFGLIFKASEPDVMAKTSHYAVFFAGNNNTKISLSKNETEIRTNDYIVLEFNKKYKIKLTLQNGEIRVAINDRTVLYYDDPNPLIGDYIGFIHRGQSVIYSKIRIKTKGLPLKTDTIDVPEALLSEECYVGARRRFLDIYRNHNNRYIGYWACYRAGVASWHINKNTQDALKLWDLIKESRYNGLKQLGLAYIETQKENYSKAADYIMDILQDTTPNILLKSIESFSHETIQNLTRQKTEYPPEDTEKWLLVSIELDKILDRHDPVTISLLSNWVLKTTLKNPKNIKSMVKFLKTNLTHHSKEFSDIILNEDLLFRLFKRASTLKNNTFLTDKLMRLILWHENAITDIETLGRFYLSSGHIKVAYSIFSQLVNICLIKNIKTPSSPLAYVAHYEWLHGNYTEARKTFKHMVHSSKGWGKSDGVFLLGLDDYRRGKKLNAIRLWQKVKLGTKDHDDIRYLIAKGLLDELPPDPESAMVPDRTDYRTLYSLFIGLRHYLDFMQTQDEQSKKIATDLLLYVFSLNRSSYDIYVSTPFFSQVPLEDMGVKMSKQEVETLGQDEKDWLKELVTSIQKEI